MTADNVDPRTGVDDLNDLNDLNALRRQRVTKLAALIEAGISPFGQRVEGIEATACTRRRYTESDQGQEVAAVVAGRLLAKRDMGKSTFANIRDQSGPLQLYVQKNQVGDEQYQWFKALDIGDIITARGTVFTTRTGEVSLRVESFELLAKSLRPLPEKWHGLQDVKQRYHQRYLDLISNDTVMPVFRTRCDVIRTMRRYLDERGFLEVETPMLQPIPGGAAARPFETYYNALDCPMFLRIAPELYLKRLLVGGFEKVYEINRNFRNEGLSRRHNPEFTMIELYQAYSDCRGMMDLVEDMVVHIARDVIGSLQVPGRDDQTIDLTPPWRRVAYNDLVQELLGPEWFELPIAAKADRARMLGLDVDPDMTDGAITHEIYEKVIEQTLVQPTFVTRLPAFLVPLAKRCADDASLVDVYELEINGQEISPGYSELNDPVEQRRRFEEQNAAAPDAAETAGGRIDDDFLVAMEHGMPPAGGMGLGIDRLVMLLTGAESIRDVILFPQMRPHKP